MTAPPTAQEALASLKHLHPYGGAKGANDCCDHAYRVALAFIQHAAAEADAWAKIEAWLKADEGREFYWSYTMGKPRLVLDAPDAKERFTTLQLVAAWCAKEGA